MVMTTDQQTSAASRTDVVAKHVALRREAEHLVEQARELWFKVKDKARRPVVGATVAGVAVLAAGAAWGASEAAVAAFAAYAVFRLLRRSAYPEAAEERGPRAPAAHDGPTSARPRQS
jgi:hypothetical protein